MRVCGLVLVVITALFGSRMCELYDAFLASSTGGCWLTTEEVFLLVRAELRRRSHNYEDFTASMLIETTGRMSGTIAADMHVVHANWTRHSWKPQCLVGGTRRVMYRWCVLPIITCSDKRVSRKDGRNVAKYDFPVVPESYYQDSVFDAEGNDCPISTPGQKRFRESGAVSGVVRNTTLGLDARSRNASSRAENDEEDRDGDSAMPECARETFEVRVHELALEVEGLRLDEYESDVSPPTSTYSRLSTARLNLSRACAIVMELLSEIKSLFFQVRSLRTENNRLREVAAVSELQIANKLQVSDLRASIREHVARTVLLESHILRLESDLLDIKRLPPTALVASSDATLRRDDERRRFNDEYIDRTNADKKHIAAITAIHGGPDGFRWRIKRLVLDFGSAWIMGSLLIDASVSKLIASMMNIAARQSERDRKQGMLSYICRLRMNGIGYRKFDQLSKSREVVHDSTTGTTSRATLPTPFGHVDRVKILLSRHLEKEALEHYLRELKNELPKTLGSKEAAALTGIPALADTPMMMHDPTEYVVAIIKLVMETSLREHVIWFLDENDKLKFLHFEFGFEVDGFPYCCGSAVEFLMHLFNLGHLCEHLDLNFAYMGGDFGESDASFLSFMHWFDTEWAVIIRDGLDIQLDVPIGAWEDCHGPGVYHCTFGASGKGDLSWLLKGCGTGAAGSNHPHLSHRLDRTVPASPVANVSEHARVTVDERQKMLNESISAREKGYVDARSKGKSEMESSHAGQCVKFKVCLTDSSIYGKVPVHSSKCN
jgi:hypothetical protein